MVRDKGNETRRTEEPFADICTLWDDSFMVNAATIPIAQGVSTTKVNMNQLSTKLTLHSGSRGK